MLRTKQAEFRLVWSHSFDVTTYKGTLAANEVNKIYRIRRQFGVSCPMPFPSFVPILIFDRWVGARTDYSQWVVLALGRAAGPP